MPFTPLTATHRLQMQYVITGFTHTIHAYCERGADILGAKQLVDRDGILPLPFQDVAQEWWADVSLNLGEDVPPPVVLLQERSGLLWLPIDSFTPTGTGGSDPSTLANQLTVVVRDTDFRKIRITVLETINGYVGHSPSGRGIDANIDAFCDAIDGVDTDIHAIYRWQKSRGDNFILATGAIAGATLDLNDKLKRGRGYE